MAERRPLTEGLKSLPSVDPHREKEFVYGAKPANGAPKPQAPVANQSFRREPISTRIRGDFAEAIRRASLERQLQKIEPNMLCDILEEALEPWLRANGFIQ